MSSELSADDAPVPCRMRAVRRSAFPPRAVALPLVLLLFFGGNARAEGGEVTVRGEGAGAFQSTATIEDAPREVTDAASLVEPLPGVHVRRLGADDSFATLSIRGSSSTEVAIYLAGVPLSGGADPTL